jgi:hypothetical protein
VSEQKTIFEGLYQIDWSKLEHIYGAATSVPDSIRDLLSDDDGTRQDARGFLFGEGSQEYGMITETTPVIAPFLFEILSLDEAHEREKILYWLRAYLEANQRVWTFRSVDQIKRHISIYETVEKHLPLIFKLLDHSYEELRRASAGMLGTLEGDITTIVPGLTARFHIEEVLSVKEEILKALERLFSIDNYKNLPLCEIYGPFFRAVIEGDYPHRIRYGAARAGLMATKNAMSSGDITEDEISSQTSKVLLEGFWNLYEPDNYYLNDDLLMMIVLLPDAISILWQIMHDSRLVPQDVHRVLRAVLYAKYSPRYNMTSLGPEFREKLSKRYFYHQFYTKYRNLREDALIKAIVDDDLLWQKPTNLFSYFLGLPDSRDELRAFLRKR